MYNKSKNFRIKIFLNAKANTPLSEEEVLKIKAFVKYNEENNNRTTFADAHKLARELRLP